MTLLTRFLGLLALLVGDLGDVSLNAVGAGGDFVHAGFDLLVDVLVGRLDGLLDALPLLADGLLERATCAACDLGGRLATGGDATTLGA